jgi:ferredoxin
LARRGDADMRVIVDTEKCVAAGQCVIEAPEVFDQRDEDGVVILLNESPGEDQLEAVRRAAELCPALAIVVVED